MSSYIFEKEGFSSSEGELLLNETLFHNANGYIGVRGNFEEGYPQGSETIRGQYINGFYNTYKINPEEWHLGFIREKHTMVNVFDTQTMKLILDDETMDLFSGNVRDFSRKLDMKKGITTRSFIWESPKGKQVEIQIVRMTSFKMLPLFLIDYRIRPLNFSGTAKILSIQSGEVSNYFNLKDSRVAGEKRHHIQPEKVTVTGDGIGLICSKTVNSGLETVSAVKHICLSDHKAAYTCKDQAVETELTFGLTEGQEVRICKYTVICDSLRYDDAEKEALKLVRTASSRPAEEWYQSQEAYLNEFWEKAAIEIKGDEELNLSLHYNLYGLLQSVGKDVFCNIGAKGLSGEGYEGHYFWDTEMYMLPFFSLTQPDIAKNLLGYRYHILDKARENARRMGHEKGALYPWRTINGNECSYYYPSGGAQYHIIGDIAYGIIQYYLITGDWKYIEEQGAEIILETARVWYDLGNFYKGKFHIHCVTGPDEYTCVVNNNYYTNVNAKHHLLWAGKIYDRLKEEGKLKKLEDSIGITQEEIEGFKEAAEKMYLPYDEDLDINPQDDSFLSKKKWDIATIPQDQGPLMQHYFLYHIYRYQICKQADTVLAHFLFEDEQKLSTMGHSFEYYEKVTTHDSSLSRCIFGIMAAKLGMKEKAYEYFDFSSKMDICNSQKNTKDGIHTANMGGTYMGVVYGFLGLRVKEAGFFFQPILPDQWEKYSLRLVLRGNVIEITVDKKTCSFHLLKGDGLTLHVYGKAYKLEHGLTVQLEEK